LPLQLPPTMQTRRTPVTGPSPISSVPRPGLSALFSAPEGEKVPRRRAHYQFAQKPPALRRTWYYPQACVGLAIDYVMIQDNRTAVSIPAAIR